MTFTYGEDLTVDRDYVRFYSGDTESPGFMSDELIASLVATQSSNNNAVIAGIEYIIKRLSKPDFRADWLQVSHAAAIKGYKEALKETRRAFGISAITATSVKTYRYDSLQDADRDYNADGSADS